METIKAELKRVREENNTLRMMLEVLSSKYTKLETHLQEINKTQHKGMSSNQIGSLTVPPMFHTNKRARLDLTSWKTSVTSSLEITLMETWSDP